MSSFEPVVAWQRRYNLTSTHVAAEAAVLDILDERPLVEDVYASGPKDISMRRARLSFSFAYDDERILDNISVDISTDGIVGCGKRAAQASLPAKLLMRYGRQHLVPFEKFSGTPLEQIASQPA